MSGRLDGRVAVITGAGSGIGRATALRFARDGAKVVAADIDSARVDAVVAEIAAEVAELGAAGTAIPAVADVGESAQVEGLVAAAVDAFGRLDIMFNNAGIAGERALLDPDHEADYRRTLRIDQDGVYYGIRAAAKQFVAQGGGGVIVNTASIYARVGADTAFAYSVAKAAVEAMTRSAAFELAEHGIRVVAIAPGRVETNIVPTNEAFSRYLGTEQLRGVITQPEEIADLVAVLASDDARVVNGTLVFADDGWSVFKMRFPT